jgi:hypothetical protein
MSASTTAAVAAIAVQRQKAIQHFVSVGAIAPEHAVASDSLPAPILRVLRGLKREEVVRETPAGLLYLDVAREAELQTRRQSFTLKFIVAAVLLALATAAFLTL